LSSLYHLDFLSLRLDSELHLPGRGILTTMAITVTEAPADCYSKNFYVRKACRAACTLATCPLDWSFWAYLPSLAANSLFAALFGISFVAYVLEAVLSRRFLGFSIAMISGSVLEILGYAGRIWSRYQPFNEVRRICRLPTLDHKHISSIPSSSN